MSTEEEKEKKVEELIERAISAAERYVAAYERSVLVREKQNNESSNIAASAMAEFKKLLAGGFGADRGMNPLDRHGCIEGGKVAVIGSRNFQSLSRVTAFVRSLPAGSLLVSGGAEGVDRAAESAARAARISRWIFEPVPIGLGTAVYTRALFERNHRIVEACDRVVAFHDGSSRGTLEAINFAIKIGKPYEIREG